MYISAKPFLIDVPQEKIDVLQKKLALTVLPDELDNAGWDYGAPLADIRRLLKYWQNDFKWRAQESRLNAALPQYIIPIDIGGFGTIDIHFVHQKSTVPNAIPLLFCHGWPGHFLEVMKILPDLVKGGTDFPAFDVVAPSLPNYGFSEGVKKKGFGPKQYAEVCHKLMLALSYPKYVTQGGDWGSVFTRAMGLYYPESCLASHVNMATPNAPSASQPLPYLSSLVRSVFGFEADENAGLKRSEWFTSEGNGYYKEQATRPQTIGYSQADSPIGILAWIYEKLHDWTDDYPWTDDEILVWVSIYIFSRAGAWAPSRTYYEHIHDKEKIGRKVNGWVPDVLLGVARFPKELTLPPKSWYATMGKLVYQSEHSHGGHFAAWERPDAIVNDLRSMFGKRGGAFGVVPNRNGYGQDQKSRL